jgi:putative acetyltransferase
MITLRPERADDIEAIRRIYEHAFETPVEADLVDALRDRGKLVASVVAQTGEQAVGHITFSPVSIASSRQLRGVALGPIAVLPRVQKRGIGSGLVRAGLQHCRELGYDYVVVVGHPEYYRRFGFVPASQFGISCLWELPEGVFMALELRPQALAGTGGPVTYEAEFNGL